MTKLLTTLILLLCPLWLRAQSFPYQLLTPVELPPSENMTKIYFDRHGMMWLGTHSGLKQYDGYTVRTYRSDAYTPGILPNNCVESITEDHDSHLWIGTRDGLARMDLRTGTFKTYRLGTGNQRIVYALFTAKDGTVYAGTDHGLNRYNPKTDGFDVFEGKTMKVSEADGTLHGMDDDYEVKTIAESNDGQYLYIGTWSRGLLRLRKGEDTFYRYSDLNGERNAFALSLDSKGRLWIGTWNRGILCLQQPTDFTQPEKLSFYDGGDAFRTIYALTGETPDGRLWACSREGVAIIDLAHIGDGFAHFTATGGRSSQPLGFNVGMAMDAGGHVWLQERYRRIKQIATRRPMVTQLFADVANKPSNIRSVHAIHTDDGRHFWLALLPYGLALYDRATNSAAFNADIPGFAAIGKEKLHCAVTQIIRRRSTGELWMASNSYGIIVVPPSGKAYTLNTTYLPGLHDDYVSALAEGRDATMWLGTRSGIVRMGQDGKAILMKMSSKGHDYTYCDTRHLNITADGNIWAATENEGIIRISPRKGGGYATRQYSPQRGGLPVQDATATHEDSRGRLWAISNSGGLFLYNAKSDSFAPMNRAYHIDGDKVCAINEDRRGNLWMTTDQALIRLAFNEGIAHVTSYGRVDGLGDILFPVNSTSGWRDELYFGTGDGFAAFTPSLEGDVKQEGMNIAVTDIDIDGVSLAQLDAAERQTISELSAAFTRKLTISSTTERIGVEFALLSYASPSTNRYAYRLEGYNDDWVYLQAGSHSASFENLPSGTYRLFLRAADNHGRWTELPYSITIRVLPHWWATWWAFLIYATLLALAVYGGIAWYKRHLSTRNRLQMAVLFTNIAHELLTPLAVVSASVDDLRARAPQFAESYNLMQRNIQGLTRLLRQILEVRKAQAGQLRLLASKGDLGGLVTRECEGLRPLAAAKKLTLTVDAPTQEAWFDPDKIDKIVQNLVSNSVKYTNEGGHISVTLTAQEGKAILTVTDDGIGISKEKMRHLYQRFLDGDYRRMGTLGTGIGLSLTRDLVRLHHGRIDCESVVGRGTTFRVTLPTAKEAFAASELQEGDNAPAEKAIVDEAAAFAPVESGKNAETIAPEDDSHTVLIVEDNAELLGVMERVLGRKYRVLTARDGQKALKVIARESLDLVVSDVMMPNMDGIELTQAIKENADTAQLPVILLTAKTADEDRQTGYTAGADDYLTKPFRTSELLLRIDNIIANRERIRRKFSRQTDFHVEEQHYSSPDEEFVRRAMACVKAHVADSDYSRDALAAELCVSGSTLYNKLRALTGMNISSFIANIRLKEACRIARANPSITVNELSARVGFNTPKYFSRCFKEEFGMSVKEYIETVS